MGRYYAILLIISVAISTGPRQSMSETIDDSVVDASVNSAAAKPFLQSWEEFSLSYTSSALWSECKDIALSGNYAFVTSYYGLMVFDVNDPTSPQLVSKLYLPEGYADDIAVEGDLACVAMYGPGDYSESWPSAVYVVDISNPLSPAVAGRWAAPSSTHGVDVRDGLAYVVYGHIWGETGVAILDISNSGQIMLLGKCILDLVNPPSHIQVAGNTAFVSAPVGIIVVDVSDPYHPEEKQTIQDLEYRPYEFDVSDDDATLYVSYRDLFWPESMSAVSILNIADPLNPIEISRTKFGVRAMDVDVEGDYLYLCNSTCGLKVVDISDPSAPTKVGTYDVPGLAFRAAVHEGLVYLIDGGILTDVDTEGGSCPATQSPEGPFFDDFIIVDASAPAEPTLKGFYSMPGHVTKLAVRSDLLLALDDTHSEGSFSPGADLTILDITNLSNPTVVGTYSTPGQGYSADFISDSVVIVAVGTEGFDILSLADPSNPIQVGSYPTSGEVVDIRTINNLAFTADLSGVVNIYDITNINIPQYITTINMVWPVWSIEIQWPYLFVAALDPISNGRLCIFDVSIPSSPQELYRLEGSPYSSVHVSGNRMYPAWNKGFSIFEIDDPNNPQVVYTYGGAPAIHGIAVAGNHVLVTNGLEGIQVLDVSNSDSVYLAGSYNTSGFPDDVLVDGRYVFVADYWGLSILEYDTQTDAPEDNRPELPDGFALNQNYPNPFNSSTVISFRLPTKAHCHLTIYNTLGQFVRTLANGSLPNGDHTYYWNGKNANGEAVASGVYFYELDIDGTKAAKKMILLE